MVFTVCRTNSRTGSRIGDIGSTFQAGRCTAGYQGHLRAVAGQIVSAVIHINGRRFTCGISTVAGQNYSIFSGCSHIEVGCINRTAGICTEHSGVLGGDVGTVGQSGNLSNRITAIDVVGNLVFRIGGVVEYGFHARIDGHG